MGKYRLPVAVQGVSVAMIDHRQLQLLSDTGEEVGRLGIPDHVLRHCSEEKIVYGWRSMAIDALASGNVMVVRDGGGRFHFEERGEIPQAHLVELKW